VWGTDPTRWSELISNKVLITKVMDDIPKTTKIKIPKAFQDTMNSPEGNLWEDTMDYKLTKLGGMNTVKNGFSNLTKEQIGQEQQGKDIMNDC